MTTWLRSRQGRNSKSRNARIGLLTLWGILLSPCHAGKVEIFVGKDGDLTHYKTYHWLPTRVLAKTGIVEDDPEISPLIREAVDRELSARGFKEVAQGGDLQVATTVLAESIPQVEALIFPAYTPQDFVTPIQTVGRYNRQGTLVVNLIDSRTNKTAWAGLARETIDNKPGGGRKKIPKATANMFKRFPVKK